MFDADVIKILDRFGDCSVADTSDEQVERIEKMIGYKLTVKPSTSFQTGYIIYKTDQKIEVKKGRKKCQTI